MSAAKVTWHDPWDAVWERVKKEKDDKFDGHLRERFDFIDRDSPAWKALNEAWFRYMDTIKTGPSKLTYERGCRLLAEFVLGERAIERRCHGIPDAFFHLCTTMDDRKRYAYIDSWLAALADSGLSLKSIATYLHGPRGFSVYLSHRGLAQNHILNKIYRQIHSPSKGEAKKRPKQPGAANIERMIGVINTGDPQGARDYAMFRVIVDFGLRVSECLTILRRDYTPASGNTPAKLVVISAKTRAGSPPDLQEYMLPVQTDHAIRHWLATPPQYLPGGTAPETLFYGVSGRTLGKPVTPRDVNRLLKRYCAEAYVPPFGAHALRRYAGNHARRAMEKLGLDKGDLMDFMRHKHWATTEIYTQPDPKARLRLAQEVASSIEPRRTVERILDD